MVTAERLRADIERLKVLRGAASTVVPADRLEFATAAGLPDLDPWQEKLLRSDSSRILLNCSRQSGKSTMAAIIALHQALSWPSSLVLILAPAERQAKELFTKVAQAYRVLGHAVPAESWRPSQRCKELRRRQQRPRSRCAPRGGSVQAARTA